MQTYLAIMDKIAKEDYKPAWNNQMNIAPSALLAKLRSEGIVSGKIVESAPIGLNGGYGGGYEDDPTPKTGEQRYEKFTTGIMNRVVSIGITDKVMRIGKDSAGNMIDAFKGEVEGALATAKWNKGRTLFGNGSGKLCTVAAAVTGNDVVVSDCTFLKEGLIVDFFATADVVGTAPYIKQRRIKNIVKATKTVTFDGAAFTATPVQAGFITVQNCYGSEIIGLGAIFDDSITSLYGVPKAGNDWLKPVAKDVGNDITNLKLREALRESEDDKGGGINMILASPTAIDAYSEYLDVNNIRYLTPDQILRGGYAAISFKFGNQDISIVEEKFIPAGEMWGVNTEKIVLRETPWDYMEGTSIGSMWTKVPGFTKWEAVMTSYGNMICKDPGACIRWYGVNAAV